MSVSVTHFQIILIVVVQLLLLVVEDIMNVRIAFDAQSVRTDLPEFLLQLLVVEMSLVFTQFDGDVWVIFRNATFIVLSHFKTCALPCSLKCNVRLVVWEFK